MEGLFLHLPRHCFYVSQYFGVKASSAAKRGKFKGSGCQCLVGWVLLIHKFQDLKDVAHSLQTDVKIDRLVALISQMTCGVWTRFSLLELWLNFKIRKIWPYERSMCFQYYFFFCKCKLCKEGYWEFNIILMWRTLENKNLCWKFVVQFNVFQCQPLLYLLIGMNWSLSFSNLW